MEKVYAFEPIQCLMFIVTAGILNHLNLLNLDGFRLIRFAIVDAS